jgi:putative transposase
MVRAGAVKHPSDWAHCGYSEIEKPRERYTIVDLLKLSGLRGFREVADFSKHAISG